MQELASTLQKTRDLEEFVEKNADNGAKCRLDSSSGRRRRGCLKFPSLGGPHAGEKIKKHPLGGPRGGNRGPGRPGLRMAAKLFEIEMQITCTSVKKTTVMYVNYLAPVTDLKKTCGVGGHPTRSGVNTYLDWHSCSLMEIVYNWTCSSFSCNVKSSSHCKQGAIIAIGSRNCKAIFAFHSISGRTTFLPAILSANVGQSSEKKCRTACPIQSKTATMPVLRRLDGAVYPNAV